MQLKIPMLMAIVAAIIVAFYSQLPAQSQRSAKDGVYSGSQAKRGEDVIAKTGCPSCHGNSLDGGPDETPGLWGPEFITAWVGQTLFDLSLKLNQMPPENPVKMSRAEYADIIAYLLQINGYPAGRDDLSGDPGVLEMIRITDAP